METDADLLQWALCTANAVAFHLRLATVFDVYRCEFWGLQVIVQTCSCNTFLERSTRPDTAVRPSKAHDQPS
jgi:hypothetical protein